jgi:glycosyltransferase involved in cell wall biosynthesis
MSTVVIIPAYNEENSVGLVVQQIPKAGILEVVVVNNNSNDNTVLSAQNAGALVLTEKKQGYGHACLKGISHIKKMKELPQYVVFIDADYSDYPEQLPLLVKPLEEGYDMVIGSRALGKREKGSMMPQQLFGNWLATSIIKLLYGFQYTDLGPFRAIRYDKLLQLDMQDTTYGWTVEMQIKALKHKLKIKEVPVDYKKRIGHSKISGTIKGTIMAGYKIIFTIFKYR